MQNLPTPPTEKKEKKKKKNKKEEPVSHVPFMWPDPAKLQGMIRWREHEEKSSWDKTQKE